MLWEAPTCVICLTELTNNLTATACGHVYHSECIEKCVFSSCKNCPLCRNRVVPSKLVPITYNLTHKDRSITIAGLTEEESRNITYLQMKTLESQNEKKRIEEKLRHAEILLTEKSEIIIVLQNNLEEEKKNFTKTQKKLEDSMREISHNQYEAQKYLGLFTNAHKKLKELETKANQLESLSKLLEEIEKKSTIAWATHVKETLNVDEQAVQFYNALLINHNSLKNSEIHIKELKLCNDEYIQQTAILKRQLSAGKKEIDGLKRMLSDLETRTNTSSLKRPFQEVLQDSLKTDYNVSVNFQDIKKPKKTLSLLTQRINM